MIGSVRSTFAKAGALCAGLLLVSAPAVAQEDSSGELPVLDRLLGREVDYPNELEPTGRRLYVDEMLSGLGLLSRGGFGLQALEEPADEGELFPDYSSLVVIGDIEREDRQLVSLERINARVYPSHTKVSWRGDGLSLVQRTYITDDDSVVLDLELCELTGERDRELRFVLSGELTEQLERLRSRFEVLSLSSAPAPLREVDAVQLASGRVEHDGIVFHLTAGSRSGVVRCVGPSSDGESVQFPLPDPRPAIAQLHLLLASGEDRPSPPILRFEDGSEEKVWIPGKGIVAGFGERASIVRVELPGARARLWHLYYDPPPGRFPCELVLSPAEAGDTFLLAGLLEIPPPTGRLAVLLGELPTPTGTAQLCLAGTEFGPISPGGHVTRGLHRYLTLPAGETLRLRAVLAIGPRILPVIARAIDATVDDDHFTEHLTTYHRWFEEQVPRFSCSDPRLERAWWESWLRLRRRLLRLGERGYSLPIFREPGASHVELESLPDTLRAARWLKGLEYVQGPVRAFVMRQREDSMFPLRLPPGSEWGSLSRLSDAVVDAFVVNGSELFLRENLPFLVKAALALLDAEESLAAAELPHLARGFRALGDEKQATALEERWKTAIEEEQFKEQLIEDWRTDVGAHLGFTLDAPEEGSTSLGDEMIRLIGGLRPRDDGRIELRPSYRRLSHFAFEGLHYRGRVLDIYWDCPDGVRVRDEIPEGHTLLVDGELCFHAETLAEVVLD